MALKAEFTGLTHIIKIKSGENNIDVQKDLYSAAKDEWLNEVNNLHKYKFPFITIGGNDIGGGQKAPTFYFLQYPWKIETNGDNTLHSFALNLFGQDENGNSDEPFIVLPGDSVTNNTSNVPGSDLLQLINNNTSEILNLIWNNAEKSEIRDALGVTGNRLPSSNGIIHKNLECCENNNSDSGNSNIIIGAPNNSGNSIFTPGENL